MESMKKLDRIEEMINEEIKPLVSKNDISPAELKNLGEAVDIIKDIQTIKAMKKAEEEDTMQSQESRSSYGRSYGGNRSYGSYDDMSMAMGRNSGRSYGSYEGNSGRMMPYPYYMYDAGVDSQGMNSQGMNSQEIGGMQSGYNRSRNSYGQNSMQSMDGNSMDGRRGRDADNDGRYSEDGSYRRGRDARGRYTSRDYSSHTEREMMIEHLEDMADDARTERERRTIEKCIDKLTRY